MKRAAPLTLALLTLAAEAHANGRFPASNQIATTTGNADLQVVRTTFGLLVSKNGGKSYEWICEQAMGYSGTQDPGIAVLADGSLVVAAFEGLAVSHDGGCTWAYEQAAGLANEYVIDVAAEQKAPEAAVVVTSTGVSIGNFHVEAFRTADNGKTWASLGPALDKDILAETIDTAPSNPKRLYVSGETGQGKDRKGVLATSEDMGVTWTRAEVDLMGDQQLFIAAVDPVDEKRVYLRTVGSLDRLLVTKDAGKTFESVLQVTRPLTGFAVSPDGETIVLGGPDVGWAPGTKPADATERKPSLLGAKKGDLAFAEIGKKTSQCLGWTGTGLFACGESFNDGYVIGLSGDQAKTFAPLLPKLGDIAGPLTCPAESSVTKQCAPLWPALKAQFGGGSGGSSGAGGTSGAGGSAAATPSDDGGSCGCRAAGGGAPWGFLGLLALGGAVACRKRVTSRGRKGMFQGPL